MIVRPDQITELTSSITEPVTTAYAKQHMRVDISDDDTLIDNLVAAARERAEKYCNRSFVAHTYRADLSAFWDMMTLPFGPVQSVSSIKYYDTESPSVLQTLSTSVYALNRDTVFRNHGASWESVYPRTDAVQITYVTGWRDQSSPQGVGPDCPEAVKSAILMMAGDLYENREEQFMYPGQLHVNRTVAALLDHYRLYQ